MANKLLNILLVDDEIEMLDLYEEKINNLATGHKVFTARMGNEACELCKKQPIDVAFVDYQMPKMNGIETGSYLLGQNPDMILYMLTAYDHHIEEAFNAGFNDYLLKPVSDRQLNTALTWAQLLVEKKRCIIADSQQRDNSLSPHINILSQSKAMFKVMEKANKVANTDTNVLLTGNSGTGKNLVAYHIHCQSKRKPEAYVKVDCTTIPKELMESELFGHEKGSFTSATSKRIGKFEYANKGTIFLDEIGDLSLSLQSKLLRVIQEREFERVGSNKTVKVNIRIVSATNKNLEQKISEGTFRKDLFYRLNVIPIKLPKLAERMEDIELLAEHLALKHAEIQKKIFKNFSLAAMNLMQAYQWPGNVRELENAIEHAIALLDKHQVDIMHLPDNLRAFSEKATDIYLSTSSDSKLENYGVINIQYPKDFKETGADFDQTIQYINKMAELVKVNPEKSKWELKEVDAHFGGSNNFRSHLLKNPEAYILIIKNNPELKLIFPILKKNRNIHKRLLQEGLIE